MVPNNRTLKKVNFKKNLSVDIEVVTSSTSDPDNDSDDDGDDFDDDDDDVVETLVHKNNTKTKNTPKCTRKYKHKCYNI